MCIIQRDKCAQLNESIKNYTDDIDDKLQLRYSTPVRYNELIHQSKQCDELFISNVSKWDQHGNNIIQRKDDNNQCMCV